jgi:hypothetical protein
LIALQKALRYSLVPVLLLLGDGKAGAQSRGVRFEITQVGDSTFRFPRGTANWVKPGETGIAVDPRRHDVLVARFRVARIDSGLVTAVVTGQTTRVATEHIAVITEPQALTADYLRVERWDRGSALIAGCAVPTFQGCATDVRCLQRYRG